jgi:hypothetical protein
MYMHLSRLQKSLGLDAPFRHKRHCLLHRFPAAFPEFAAQSGFSKAPMWLGSCNLPLSRRRQAEEVISLVPSWFDVNPTLLPHPVQGPRERGAVHYEAFAQPFLIHFSGCSQCRENSKLCNLESRLLEFLFINPRDDPGCAPKVLASAGQGKERFGGGWFKCRSGHNICIYTYRYRSSSC